MCGIPERVVQRAEEAARVWEHTSRLSERLETAREGCYIPLGVQSDVAALLRAGNNNDNNKNRTSIDADGDRESDVIDERGLEVLRLAIASL